MGAKLDSTSFLMFWCMHSLVLAFAALCELLDLAELDGVEGITDDNGVVGDVSGQVGGHLIANVKQVLVLLEPLAGHGALRGVPLHGLHIDVVAGVQDVHFPDTGCVADLGLRAVLLLGQLLNQASPRLRLSPAAFLKRM